MARPQIRPSIFIAFQNAMAAALFAALLGAELVRRLLYEYPQFEILWRLSTLANRTVMPVLRYVEEVLPDPQRLLLGLLAGVVIPLLAWRWRYWFATAVAGHVTLAALIIMTYSMFRRGNVALATLELPEALAAITPNLGAFLFLGLSVFALVMCIADHVAFIRHIASLWSRFRKARQ